MVFLKPFPVKIWREVMTISSLTNVTAKNFTGSRDPLRLVGKGVAKEDGSGFRRR